MANRVISDAIRRRLSTQDPRGRHLVSAVLSACLICLTQPGSAVAFKQQSTLSNGATQVQSDISRLDPATPIERELADDQIHLYELRLGAGWFLHAVVNQRGIDVAVAVFGPSGKKIYEVDNAKSLGGNEHVFLAADEEGTYRLEVGPAVKPATRGRYEVRIEGYRAARQEDIARAGGEKALAEAVRLRREHTSGAQQRTLEKLQEALPLMRAAGNRPGEYDTVFGIATVYYSRGEERKALQYYLEGLTVAKAMNNRSAEARMLGNIGTTYHSLGEQQKALHYYDQALHILEALGELDNKAVHLNNIGMSYNSLGEKQKALDYFNEGLNIIKGTRALPAKGRLNIEVEPALLNNIGYVYNSIGENRKAIEYYTKALDIVVKRDLRAGKSTSLNNIGVAYNSLGEPQKALSYFNQALTIAEDMADRKVIAVTLNNLGLAFNSLGKKSEALDYFNQAVRIFEDLGVRLKQAATLYNIGNVHDSMGENNKALDYYRRALPIVQAVGARNEEAAILFNMARAERALDRPLQARAHSEAALDITESLRTKVVGPEFRSSFLASVQQYYEFHIDLLMQMHKQHLAKDGARAAFKAAERRRARTLLEGFIEARADIRKGVDPALLERERSLESLLNGKMERRIRLLSGEHTPEQAAEVTEEVDKYITEYHEIQSRIRANSPQYASLTQPVPLSLEEIQREVLDPDTLLLEYFLGEKRSYVWAVTNSSLTSFELPSRHRIEAAAHRVYNLLTERNRRVKFEDAAERSDRLAAADSESLRALQVLSRMILGPVSQALTKKRLLIVSDRMLQYVPFAALNIPARTANSVAAQRPLVLDHEVVSLPSASTLAVLRRELSGRKPATRTFAILADPVFERADPRVVTTDDKTQPVANSDTPDPQRASLDMGIEFANSETERSLTELITDETGKIRRLPFTRQEAKSIIGLIGRADTLQGLDFDANRSLAMSPEIGQYKYLHFATHAIFNNEHPELSGIVLSLVNKSGGEQDGFLKAYEVYQLKLNADLVVLSSCRTALGKEVRGEGMLSLTRGFMYAGASRVLASLWNVSDEATAQLMINFYQDLLSSLQASPSSAIRAAQIKMWNSKRWQSPYYWAGFTLQGEPR